MTDATRAGAPAPVETRMQRRWRWDHFADVVDAMAWLDLRKKEGHRVRRHGLWVSWDMEYKPAGYREGTKLQYPKEKIDHCPHCEERRTYVRIGTGKLDERPTERRRGRRDYRYEEAEPRHACVGLLKERKAMAESQKRVTRMLNRILRDMR